MSKKVELLRSELTKVAVSAGWVQKQLGGMASKVSQMPGWDKSSLRGRLSDTAGKAKTLFGQRANRGMKLQQSPRPTTAAAAANRQAGRKLEQSAEAYRQGREAVTRAANS